MHREENDTGGACGGEVDLRINIYRSQFSGTNFLQHSATDTGTAGELPGNRRETAGKLPTTEQERQIYKFTLENGFITTTQVTELLGVKPRRAREILGKMTDKNWLRKEGASRSTIYVICTEGGFIHFSLTK